MPTNTLPPDRYGETTLPRVAKTIRLNGTAHPIEISGRTLRCTLHQGTNRDVLSTWSLSKAPACVKLSQQWHDSFVVANTYPVYASPIVNNAHDAVWSAIVDEIAHFVPSVTLYFARLLFWKIPELRRRPELLAGARSNGVSPVAWSAYCKTQDDDLLPFLRIKMNLDIDTELPPDELNRTLWAQIRAQCLCHTTREYLPDEDVDSRMLANLPPPNARMPKLRPPEPIIDLSATPISIDGHAVTIREDGAFVCHAHPDNNRCQREMDAWKSDPPQELHEVLLKIFDNVMGFGNGGLDSGAIAPTPIKKTRRDWLHSPSAWSKAGMIPAFSESPIHAFALLTYISHDLTPAVVERWTLQAIQNASQIVACEAIDRLRGINGDGYVATLASQWTESLSREVELALPEHPDIVKSVVEYQEAGWDADDIAELMYRRSLSSETTLLYNPPETIPPVPLSALLAEEVVDSQSSEMSM